MLIYLAQRAQRVQRHFQFIVSHRKDGATLYKVSLRHTSNFTSYFRLHASDFIISHRGRRGLGGNPGPPSFHAGCQGTRSVESPRGRHGLLWGAMDCSGAPCNDAATLIHHVLWFIPRQMLVDGGDGGAEDALERFTRIEGIVGAGQHMRVRQ